MVQGIDLSQAIGLPPEKVSQFFQSKTNKVSWKWHEVWQDAHATSFTVAKVTRLDVLQDIRGMVQKAIDEGITFEQFKKELTPKLQAKGWWGWQTDPKTGHEIELGSPRRLETIYRTNLNVAYSVGRYKEMMDNVDNRPFWQYVAILDNRTRPSHKVLNGKVFKYDDPFWDTHYPPNDWLCFPAGSLVATPTEWKPIETINIGDLVIGGSGNIQPVTDTHIRDFNGELIRLSSKSISALMTPNHRILTMRGWISAENLKISDVLVQIPEIAKFDLIIGDVNQPNSRLANSDMPFPIKRESSISATFNSKFKFWNKYINPIIINKIIMLAGISNLSKMIEHNCFTSCGHSFVIRMGSRINSLRDFFGFRHFISNFWSFSRRNIPEFFCHISDAFRVGLIFSNPSMTTIFNEFIANLSHCFRSLLSSRFIVNPLSSNSLTTFSWNNAIMSNKPYDGMIVHAPSIAQLPITKKLVNIESSEGFTSGAPLDRFDSLDSFQRWSRLHGILHVITNIERVPYTGKVYNLSVKEDESYCLPIAVVHNCRCRVRALSDKNIRDRGLSVESSEGQLKITKETVGGKQRKVTIYTDPKTGIKVQPPVEWNYNPARSGYNLDIWAYNKIEKAPKNLRDLIINDFSVSGNIRKPAFAAWVEDVLVKKKDNNTMHVVGWMDSKTLDYANSINEIQFTPIIAINDKKVSHSLRNSKMERGSAVSIEDIKKLPDVIANPDIVLWDTQDKSIIYVIKADKKYKKIVVKPDYNLRKFSDPVNIIISAGIIKPGDLKDPRYKVIKGKI